MATFKMGQRVKVVSLDLHGPRDHEALGKCGVISGVSFVGWLGVQWDYRVHLGELGNEWGFNAHNLAPLTDPSADSFVESIKRLKPYEEPKVTREKAVLSGRTNNE